MDTCLLSGNSTTAERDRERVLEAKSVASKLTVVTHAGGKMDQQYTTATHLTPHYCGDTDTMNGGAGWGRGETAPIRFPRQVHLTSNCEGGGGKCLQALVRTISGRLSALRELGVVIGYSRVVLRVSERMQKHKHTTIS